jgi:hypothetical protein
VPRRQVEELALRAARDFDAFHRNRLCPSEVSDHLLILSFDAKGVATRHKDLREATRKAADATPRRLETRPCSGEKTCGAQEHERTHQAHYADRVVPSPLVSRRPKLKLVT